MRCIYATLEQKWSLIDALVNYACDKIHERRDDRVTAIRLYNRYICTCDGKEANGMWQCLLRMDDAEYEFVKSMLPHYCANETHINELLGKLNEDQNQ